MNAFLDSVALFYNEWQTLIRILLISVGAFVLRALLLVSVNRVVKGIETGAKGKAGVSDSKALSASPLAKARVVQRARTLGSVLNNFITWGIALVAMSSVLSELGVAVGALVAGAGILGAALGFGAQSLVRDLISGLFIVFEDQFGVGDSVDLGQATGIVENVGLRVTQVRDVTGTLWYVRNGEIIRVGNQSQGWARVVLDIPFAYSVKLDKAQAAILEAANALVKDSSFGKRMIGKPEVWGIEVLSGEQIVVRLVQQVGPADADSVARELRSRIKIALDKEKIALANVPIYVQVAGKQIA